VTSLAGKLQEILVGRRELGLLSIDLTLDLESLGLEVWKLVQRRVVMLKLIVHSG
jgi:hypothetical protein